MSSESSPYRALVERLAGTNFESEKQMAVLLSQADTGTLLNQFPAALTTGLIDNPHWSGVIANYLQDTQLTCDTRSKQLGLAVQVIIHEATFERLRAAVNAQRKVNLKILEAALPAPAPAVELTDSSQK